FVNASQLRLPSPQDLLVTAGAQPVPIQFVGFKRRVAYAPLKQRDLRIGNCLYLQLAAPIADGQTVQVQSVTASTWPTNAQFVGTVDPLRLNPAIHVNQVGYLPSFPKRAMVGYYLGSLGEMKMPAATGFTPVDVKTAGEGLHGMLRHRPNAGYTNTPEPYQNVSEADFGSFINA